MDLLEFAIGAGLGVVVTVAAVVCLLLASLWWGMRR